mgnify:CR=1 FL=1
MDRGNKIGSLTPNPYQTKDSLTPNPSPKGEGSDYRKG